MNNAQKFNHEEMLMESRSMRDSLADQVEVLNKVKGLTMLPDDIHTTTEQLAKYYKVDKWVIEKIAQRHRDELRGDGLRVLRGQELKEFKGLIDGHDVHLSAKSNLTLFTHRAILRIGMLLRDSEVAKQIRSYLLNVEEIARMEAPGVTEKAVIKTEIDLLLASAEWQMMAAKEISSIKQQLKITGKRLDDTVEQTDKIVSYLTEVPDRSKVNRKLKELARCFFGGRVDKATNFVYAILKDKYGIDVFQRVKNTRAKLNDERRFQGKVPYADSTLSGLVNGLDIVEKEGLLQEMMEIVVGLLSDGYKKNA